MPLTLKETRAISGLSDVLYDFLPGSGNSSWKGHVNFASVAAKVGLAEFWQGGSKKPAINALLSQTLQRKRGSFENLILEVVRGGIAYREKQGKPITTAEIDALNGHIYEVGFKFPDLWDKQFRDSLRQTTAQRAQENVRRADAEQQTISESAARSRELLQLKEGFLQLSQDTDRNKAGLALESLLNRLFSICELNPRAPFRVVGEQIDGSFLLDGEVYLVEAKWEKAALKEAELLIFRGVIEGKSNFTRGVFIALNDVTNEAKDAITRGKAPTFFVMNGYDLMMILSGVIDLAEFFRKRVRLLAEEGRVCIPFSEIHER
jgi:Restriction endonuclease